MTTTFELGAAALIWRGGEILVLKRAPGSFAGGGWFIPGGHVEAGERPGEACAREIMEETGIAIDPAGLSLADVMTYESGTGTAHLLVYNADCPPAIDMRVSEEEHSAARWMTPEAYIGRFLDAGLLRSVGLGEEQVRLAAEVARTIRAAAGRRRQSD